MPDAHALIDVGRTSPRDGRTSTLVPDLESRWLRPALETSEEPSDRRGSLAVDGMESHREIAEIDHAGQHRPRRYRSRSGCLRRQTVYDSVVRRGGRMQYERPAIERRVQVKGPVIVGGLAGVS
jgi:hypothetical protein